MYTPPQKILNKYAEVMVHFALNRGRGMKKGDVVYLVGNEVTKPLFLAVRHAIIDAGGHVIMQYLPDEHDRYQGSEYFFLKAAEHQLAFFPDKYMRGIVEQIDHILFIVGEVNPHCLKAVEPKKIMQRGLAYKKFMEWREEKEHQGKLSWTVCMYGTEGMAKEAGLSVRQYWNQIIDACFLNTHNPVQKWRDTNDKLATIKKKLDRLSPNIDRLHITGEDVDLLITLGEKRAWAIGDGYNIPSFEVFTSPDWRGTEGWIRFNQPLYRYGSLMKDVFLRFENGRVVEASASKNEKLLKEMIAQPNADKIGEFSLTDKRHSKITKFMAETLFDENVGGKHGNTHIALGFSYKHCFQGDPSRVSQKEWELLGFNDSSVHTDIMSTTPRTVTAHLHSGKQKVIYTNGMFVV